MGLIHRYIEEVLKRLENFLAYKKTARLDILDKLSINATSL
jgi:hypothetical protein